MNLAHSFTTHSTNPVIKKIALLRAVLYIYFFYITISRDVLSTATHPYAGGPASRDEEKEPCSARPTRSAKCQGLTMPWLNQRFASCGRGCSHSVSDRCSDAWDSACRRIQDVPGSPWRVFTNPSWYQPHERLPRDPHLHLGNENYVPKNLLLNCASESVSPL